MILWKLFPWDKSARENSTKDETITLTPTLKKVEKLKTPKNLFCSNFNKETTKSIEATMKNKGDAYCNNCSINKYSKHKSNFAISKMIKKVEILDDMNLDGSLINECKKIKIDTKNRNSKLSTNLNNQTKYVYKESNKNPCFEGKVIRNSNIKKNVSEKKNENKINKSKRNNLKTTDKKTIVNNLKEKTKQFRDPIKEKYSGSETKLKSRNLSTKPNKLKHFLSPNKNLGINFGTKSQKSRNVK